jgi:hypothetical protein
MVDLGWRHRRRSRSDDRSGDAVQKAAQSALAKSQISVAIHAIVRMTPRTTTAAGQQSRSRLSIGGTRIWFAVATCIAQHVSATFRLVNLIQDKPLIRDLASSRSRGVKSGIGRSRFPRDATVRQHGHQQEEEPQRRQGGRDEPTVPPSESWPLNSEHGATRPALKGRPPISRVSGGVGARSEGFMLFGEEHAHRIAAFAMRTRKLC